MKVVFLQIALFFLLINPLYSQVTNSQSIITTTQNVVPNANATLSGGNPFFGPYINTQFTYQLLIAESQLINLVGKNLVSISFRNTFNAPTSWPASDATFLNYDIYVGQSVSPENRTLVFGLNAIGLPTQVRSGNLVVPQDALTAGSNPNNFSYDIPFQIPYFYSGGNLLVEIRHFGSVSPSNRVDSVPTTDANYGTLYSACWYPSNTTSANNAFEDNFSIINFRAEDVLSLEKPIISTINIYPNPTFEYFNIESNYEIKEVKLYSLLGQLILIKQPKKETYTVDLSDIDKGTYVMSIENELGTEQKKIIKN